MLLNEIVSQAFPWKWVRKKPGDHEIAEFSAGDINYDVVFTYYDVPQPMWTLEFAINGPHGGPHGVDVSNTGNASGVFATVSDICQSFAQQHRGELLTFSGDSPRRISLYTKLAQRLGAKVEADGSTMAVQL